MKNRLSKVLANAGVASRRSSEKLIISGKVEVNGEIVVVPQTAVDSEIDQIVVEGKLIGQESKVYYALHKPTGYVCSQMRRGREKLVLDLLEEEKKLFTVGRLDKNTAGLLLVTNDGEFSHRVIHPSFGVAKEYLAKVDQQIAAHHILHIAKGTLVDGSLVKPRSVKKVRNNVIKICVGEGKKHEVRLLLEHAGLEVLELSRIRIGGLLLGKLPVGAYRALTESERSAIFQ